MPVGVTFWFPVYSDLHADYEITQDEQEHVPILICAMREDMTQPLNFYGRDSMDRFYDG